MIRQTIYKGRNDINRIAYIRKGVRISLAPITKIDMRILQLPLTITNSVSTDFPIKWQLDPVDIGVMEYKIGTNSELPLGIHKVDIFIYDASSQDGIYFNSFEINVKP